MAGNNLPHSHPHSRALPPSLSPSPALRKPSVLRVSCLSADHRFAATTMVGNKLPPHPTTHPTPLLVPPSLQLPPSSWVWAKNEGVWAKSGGVWAKTGGFWAKTGGDWQGPARRWAAGMGGGRAGAMGSSGLCPKSCKRFGVKNARGENFWAKSEGVWGGLGKECMVCAIEELTACRRNIEERFYSKCYKQAS